MNRKIVALGILLCPLVVCAQGYRQMGTALVGLSGCSTNAVSVGETAWRNVSAGLQPGGIARSAGGGWSNRAGLLDHVNIVFPGLDTDTNGVPDEIDLDNDGDGLTDPVEIVGDWASPPNPTDPLRWDSDSDSYGDGLEVNEQTDPNDPSSFPVRVLIVSAWPSERGAPEPYGYGMFTNVPLFSILTNRVESPVDEAAGTRYVCAGWEGSGDAPALGWTNVVVFALSNHTAITWRWTTQHRIGLVATNGSIDGLPDSWQDEGAIFDLQPRPSNGFGFAWWSVDAVAQGDRVPLSTTSDRPKTVEAFFSVAAWDVTATGRADLAGWRIDPGSGIAYGDIVLCNPAESGMRLRDRFLFAVTPSAEFYLLYADGLSPFGELFADVTARVLAALPGIGNGDATLDPGECVAIGELPFYGRTSNDWNGTLYARHIWTGDDWDTDGDGMPNRWEVLHGFNPHQPFDGAQDLDGDGFSNAEEYGADTDPADAGSYLGIVGMWISGEGVLIRWQGGVEAGQVFERTSNPAAPWEPVRTYSPPTARTNQIVHIAPGADRTNEAFRVRAVR